MEHGKQADWRQARRAVLEKYPKALSGWVSGAKEYVVGADGLGCFGFGESEPEAWMDAYAETLRWDEKLAAPPVSPPDLRPLVRELVDFLRCTDEAHTKAGRNLLARAEREIGENNG